MVDTIIINTINRLFIAFVNAAIDDCENIVSIDIIDIWNSEDVQTRLLEYLDKELRRSVRSLPVTSSRNPRT